MDISKEYGITMSMHRSKTPFEVADDGQGVRTSRLQQFLEADANIGPGGYRDIYAMSEAAGAPVTEAEVGGTMAGFVPGKVAGLVAVPGDITALATGLYKAAFPDEDQGRLDAFITQVEDVSNKFGSGATLGFLDDWATQSGISDEVKQGFMQGAEVGSFFGLGQGAKATGKGVAAAGKAVAEGAPARIAERGEGVTLGMGADPMAPIDEAIVGVQKALQKPTKENPVTAVPPTETEPGIIAFHGSGADFDQFSLEKIGTGEGAQAYGYGLYFTDSEDIARFYKDAVGGSGYKKLDYNADADASQSITDVNFKDVDGYRSYPIDKAQDLIKSALKTQRFNVEPDEKALNIFEMTFERDGALQIDMRDGTSVSFLKNFDGDELTVTPLKKAEGKMYKVGLAPKPDELLDYDAPFSAQSKDVQEKLLKAGYKVDANTSGSGSMILDAIMSDIAKKETAPKNARLDEINIELKTLAKEIDKYSKSGYRNFTDPKGKAAAEKYDALMDERANLPKFSKSDARKIASEKIAKAGIPGIKYKAAGSRGAAIDEADVEKNYVIFDDKAIKILEKYGIVGPVAITALGAAKQKGDEDASST